MRASWLWVFCVLVLLSTSFGASWDKINFCKEVGFCRRHRNRSAIEPGAKIVAGSVAISRDAKRVEGVLTAPGTADPSLAFAVSLYELNTETAFRFTIDDVPAYRMSARYTSDNVLEEGIEAQKLKKEQLIISDESITVAGFDPDCLEDSCLRITTNPFQVTLVSLDRNGEMVESIKMNEKMLLHFEQHKPMKALKTKKEEIENKRKELEEADERNEEALEQLIDVECDGCWEEKVKGGFTDPKARGPESNGMDISFPLSNDVYGLPERTLSFSLPNTADIEPIRFYNLDVFEFEMNKPLGLYGAIPLLVGHSDALDVAVLWLNAAETYVDISDREGGGKSSHWFSETGRMDIFLFPGPEPLDVFEKYLHLTGRPAMPNIFGLGYHQCRWNYRDQADVKYVDTRFDLYDIPYDAVWLDIEHTDGKKYFTWDYKKFPDPTLMQDEVAARGRKMVTIIDPHIKITKNYLMNDLAKKNDIYVKDGKKDFNGWCWPGNSGYLDFTNPKARKIWMGMFNNKSYPHFTENLHTWNDMNEPSVFNGPEITMPKHATHLGGWEHRDLHNTYGYFHMMATFEGLREARKDKIRPFLLSRSFFVGSQKYGTIWTGDNGASWDQLQSSVPMLLALSVAGMTFVGADVGGFFGNPSEELLIRWYQAAAWQPFFRAHAHLDTNRREPWEASPEGTEMIRDVIIERYKYMPYMYTLFVASSRGGELAFRRSTKGPPMRPMWFHFPGFLKEEEQFLLGPALLIAPNLHEGQTKLEVRLPSSALWYDLYGDMGVPFKGDFVQCDLRRMVVFQKGGTIIPTRERVRRSTKAMILDPYTLQIALDGEQKAMGELYADDSVSYQYKTAFILTEFKFDGEHLSSTVTERGAKDFDGMNATVERIRILGLQKEVKAITIDGEDGKNLDFVQFNGHLVVKAPGVPALSAWKIVFKF